MEKPSIRLRKGVARLSVRPVIRVTGRILLVALLVQMAVVVSWETPAQAVQERDYTLLVDGRKVNLDEPPLLVEESIILPLRTFADHVVPGAMTSWSHREWEARVVVVAGALPMSVEFSPLSTVDGTAYGHETVTVSWTRYRVWEGGSPLTLPRTYRDRFHVRPAPRIIHDRTYVPLRFLAEVFGYQVDYDHATRTISLAALKSGQTPAPSHTHLLDSIPVTFRDGGFVVTMPPEGYAVTPSGLAWFLEALQETNTLVDALIQLSHTDPDTHRLRFAEDGRALTIWEEQLGLVAEVNPTSVTWYFDRAGMSNFVSDLQRELSRWKGGSLVAVPVASAIVSYYLTRRMDSASAVAKLVPVLVTGAISGGAYVYFMGREDTVFRMEDCLRTATHRNRDVVGVTFERGRIVRCLVR